MALPNVEASVVACCSTMTWYDVASLEVHRECKFVCNDSAIQVTYSRTSVIKDPLSLQKGHCMSMSEQRRFDRLGPDAI